MANSIERFTVEQMTALLEGISRDEQENEWMDAKTRATYQRLIDPHAHAICRSLVHSMAQGGHYACCRGTVMCLFVTGFNYGWKAREMLLETESLEKSLNGGESGLGVRDAEESQ